MPLPTVSKEGGAEVMRYTNSGRGRVSEIRECHSAKLIYILIINYYLGSEIIYNLGGMI